MLLVVKSLRNQVSVFIHASARIEIDIIKNRMPAIMVVRIFFCDFFFEIKFYRFLKFRDGEDVITVGCSEKST